MAQESSIEVSATRASKDWNVGCLVVGGVVARINAARSGWQQLFVSDNRVKSKEHAGALNLEVRSVRHKD